MLPISTRVRVMGLGGVCIVCFFMTGCGKDKVTKENYDKITTDMTLEQVQAILGEGTKQGGDGSVMAAQVGVDMTAGGLSPNVPLMYVWESGQKSITITFKGGKVALKNQSGL